MSGPVDKYFIDCLQRRDLQAAMSFAPWGTCPPSEKRFSSFVMISLLATTTLGKGQDPQSITSPLLDLVKQNPHLLEPLTYGTLALKILSEVVKHSLFLPQTCKKLDTLVPSQSLYLPLKEIDKISPFIHGLLDSCKQQLATQTQMSEIIVSFNKEMAFRNSSALNLLFMQCFIQSAPDAPLPLKSRIAVLSIAVQESSPVQVKALQEIGRRAEQGSWRENTDGELGRALFMADLRTTCRKDFALFLRQNGKVLNVGVTRYFPDFDRDFLMQIKLHVQTMDIHSESDWEQLSSLAARVKGYPDKVLNCLYQLHEKMEGDEGAYAVGAKDFKQVLFLLLKDNFSYFLKRPNHAQRNQIEYLVHRMDFEGHLFPQDVIELTRIFSQQRKKTGGLTDLYHCLLLPYLIRHHLPLGCLQQGLSLLSGKEFQDLFLCRDFPQIFPRLVKQDLSQLKESLIRARSLWPELQIPAWAGDPASITENLLKLMVSLDGGASPVPAKDLAGAYIHFIESARQCVHLEHGRLGNGESWKGKCESYADMSGIAEGLLRLLTAASPAEPSKQAQAVFAKFIRSVYPRLSIRHDRFLALLIQLANTTPWLVSGLNVAFEFPKGPQFEAWEVGEQQKLLDALDKISLQP